MGVQHSEQSHSPGPSSTSEISGPPRFHLVRVLVVVEFSGSLGKGYWLMKYPSTFDPKCGCWADSKSASAGSWLDMQSLGSTPDLLNQKLHFSKIP